MLPQLQQAVAELAPIAEHIRVAERAAVGVQAGDPIEQARGMQVELVVCAGMREMRLR